MIDANDGKGYGKLAADLVKGREEVSFEVWFTPTANIYGWDPVVHFGGNRDAFYYTFRALNRHRAELIRKGHLFIAQPPLYRIDSGKKLFYALDDPEKDQIVKKLNGAKYEIGRFKGLGEMPAADLKKTTMALATRYLIRVEVGNVEETDLAFSQLMGKDAEPRFKFIKEKAEFVENLDV